MNYPFANNIPHPEFNRRFSAFQDAVEHTATEAVTDEMKRAWAQEAYTLMQELPPASNRAQYLAKGLKWLAAEGFTPTLISATDSKGVKALVWKDAKLKPEQRATRGRTTKATPMELAQGKLHAAYATYTAHHEALQAAKQTLARAEADFKQSYDRVCAVGAEFLALKKAPSAAQKAPSATRAPQAKATPKGALSEAMAAVLRVIGQVKEATANELSPAQFSAARMHLAMRGLVAKDAKGNYKATPAGKEALKAL